jgi:glucose/arabinose dehydrogenase
MRPFVTQTAASTTIMSGMSRRARTSAFALAIVLILAACGTGLAARTSGPGSVAAKGLRLQRIASFDQPVYVTGPSADPSRLFVLQRGGAVMLLVNGRPRSHPFLTIPSVNSQDGEQGLLGIAFAPDYASTGRFYVDYTTASNDVTVVQYRRSAANPNLADPASARRVLSIGHHAFTNHNGGQLAFGPQGDLYIGVGDGGSENDPNGNGQNTDTLLAKILRIDPSAGGGYTIPRGNPFARQGGKRAEIWAYGLRNPWRFAFDRATGDLVIGDVGQDLQEEIDFVPAGTGTGANFGWSIWEGNRRNKPGNAPHARRPSLIATHSSGYCAIIGGYVVRDRSLPSLYGRYLFGDYCRPQIESVKLDHGHASALRATGLTVAGTSSLGQDASGHIYITSLQGALYRIVAG